MKAIKIRQAGMPDLSTLVQFQLAMAKETENISLNSDVLTQGVQNLLQDPGKGSYWILENDGKKIGCFMLIPEWSDWRNGTVLWIHSLYLIPEARGKGASTFVFKSLKERILKDPSLKGLRLYVDKSNLGAKEVYTKWGMDNQHYECFEWLKST